MSLAIWFVLVFGRGGFWRTDTRLDDARVGSDAPAVAVVIPARDEAGVIEASVASHLKSRYPGRLHIVVVDDHSSDGTAALVRALTVPERIVLNVVEAPELEPGWSGKVAAMAHGYETVIKAAPETAFVLFTDADIVHAPDTLARLVAKAERDDLALVSLMALLDARGPWARMLIPAFVFFFRKLYPFALSNDPRSQVAAAAGGCMLVRTRALEAVGGLETIGGALIDDCALAGRLKSGPPRHKIWIGLTQDVVSQRDNRALQDIWRMVSRTAFTQLNHSVLLLFGTVVGMTLVYLVPVAALLGWPIHGSAFAALMGGAAWALMTAAYWPTVRFYGLGPQWSPLLPVAGELCGALTVWSAVQHWRGGGGAWKGRTYAPSSVS